MLTKILQKYPPNISIKLYFVFVTCRTLYILLTQRIVGLFILFLFVYLSLFITKYHKPFTPRELILFADSLSKDFKIALFSSFITIFGFILAFHTATISWKQQTAANLKISAAQELENFFAEILQLITDLELFIGGVLATVEKAKRDPKGFDTIFAVKYTLDQKEKFDNSRLRLSTLSSGIFRFQNKHFSSLASEPDAKEFLVQAKDALLDITGSMWVFVPTLDTNDPKLVESFLRYINEEKASNFVATCKKCGPVIASVEAGVRGILLSPVLEPSIIAIFHLAKNRSSLSAALAAIHSDYKSRNKSQN